MAGKVVAFDIGQRLMKMVYSSGGKIIKAASFELPDNMVASGEILSMDAMADFIKQCAKEENIPRTKAALVLPNSLVLSRNTTVPAMTEKQLSFNLPYEFKNYLSQDKSTYFYDYSVESVGYDEAGAPKELKLFATATLKSTIAKYREMFRRAGFTLKSAIPEEWAYKTLADTMTTDEDVVIVDLGHSESRLQILHDNHPESKRTFSSSISRLEAKVADEYNVDIHIAHSYVMTNYNNVLDSESAMEVYGDIAVELLKAVNFYNFNYNEKGALKKIFLCGGGASIEALQNAIKSALDIEVIGADSMSPMLKDIDEPWLYAKAVGCAAQG